MSNATVASERVAAEVRAWLARRNLSANQAATLLGWSQTYLSRRLTGSIPLDIEDLAALGELLGVGPAVFFDGPAGDNWTSPPAPLRRRGGAGIKSACSGIPQLAAALSALGGTAA